MKTFASRIETLGKYSDSDFISTELMDNFILEEKEECDFYVMNFLEYSIKFIVSKFCTSIKYWFCSITNRAVYFNYKDSVMYLKFVMCNFGVFLDQPLNAFFLYLLSKRTIAEKYLFDFYKIHCTSKLGSRTNVCRDTPIQG